MTDPTDPTDPTAQTGPTGLPADAARRAVVEHTRRLAESAVAAGPAAPVPTAPEWTVADLVEHVGQTQNWVAEIIERRITDPLRLPTELAARPADPHEWQTWLADSARRVTAACSDDALTAPVFNAAGDTRSGTRFWLSAMLNEAVVHGFDATAAASAAAASSTGRPADIAADIAPDIAAALVGNHLAMLTSPTWAMQRPGSAQALQGTGQTLQFLATDIPDRAGAWFVERGSAGPTWQAADRRADVTVTGPAPSLLLVLTRRLPLTGGGAAGIGIDGDAGLVRHWLENTAHVSG